MENTELTQTEKEFIINLLARQHVGLLEPDAAAIIAISQSIKTKLEQTGETE